MIFDTGFVWRDICILQRPEIYFESFVSCCAVESIPTSCRTATGQRRSLTSALINWHTSLFLSRCLFLSASSRYRHRVKRIQLYQCFGTQKTRSYDQEQGNLKYFNYSAFNCSKDGNARMRGERERVERYLYH